MSQLEREYNENKEEVIGILVAQCMRVDMEIPRVVKGNFEDEETTQE